MVCTYSSSTEGMLGPLAIDYQYLYSCTFSGYHGFFFLLSAMWVMILMSLLAHTASNYFSPTLGSICDKMNLAYDIAGVTFLALGNGAPDFFSLIASFSGDVDVLVAVGALLGGGFFISTVVVGLVATFCPCEVSKSVFLRDISFYVLAVLCVTVTAVVRHVNTAMAVCLILLYCVYVATVTSASLMKSVRKRQGSRRRSSDPSTSSSTTLAGEIALSTFNNSAVQTAFWHKPNNYLTSSSTTTTTGGVGKEAAAVEDEPALSNYQAAPSSDYAFLIVDPDDEEDADRAADGEYNDDDDDGGGDDDEEGGRGRTKTISGGYVPPFEFIIDENYYTVRNNDQNNGSSGSDSGSGSGSRVTVAEDFENNNNNNNSSSSSALTESLLSGTGTSSMLDRVWDGQVGVRNLKRRDQRLYQNVIDFLYWRQWMLQRRFRRGLCSLSEWQRYSLLQKVLFVCMYVCMYVCMCYYFSRSY